MKFNPFTRSKQPGARNGTMAEPSEALFQQWILVLVMTAGPILLFLLYCHQTVAGLVNADAMDYAQLGRNLLHGQGLITHILRPLALTHGSNALAQPDVTHGPLYPFLLSLVFGIFGARDSVVQGTSGLFYILMVPLLFFLGKRLFDRTVGLIAALVFMLNGSILEYAASGTPTMLHTFLATSLFFVLATVASAAYTKAEGETKLPRSSLVLAGILTGLLYLSDPVFFWVLPVVLISILQLHPGRRIAATAWFLLPCLLLVLPCVLRFATLTGNPVFGLRGAEFWMGTEAYPGMNGYRKAPEDPVSGPYLVRTVVRKLFLVGTAGVTALPNLPCGWILIFLVPGLFFQFRDPALNSLRRILLACMVGVFLGSMVFLLTPSLLTVVVPGLLVYAVAYLVYLIQQAKLRRPSIVLAGGLLSTALTSPLFAILITIQEPASTPPAEVARSLRQQSRPEEVSFSDQPWVVAWYADRPAIWIPVNENHISTLRKQFPKARWLFLTREARGLSPVWNLAFNDLMNWSRHYQEAQQSNSSLPPEVRIVKNQLPITEALEGFTTMPPVEKGTPTVVVAAVPLNIQ